MFEFEAPKVEKPKRSDIFGKPGAPIAICMSCNRMFPVNEMQQYRISPSSSMWKCSKCSWKMDMREKFSGKI